MPKRLAHIIVILTLLFLPAAGYAQATTEPDFSPVSDVPSVETIEGEQDQRLDEKETAEAIKEASEEKEGKEPKKSDEEVEEECHKGSQACNVDRKVKQIETLVEDARQRHESQDIWALPGMKETPTGRKKVATYIISAPTTYLVRFITWPVAFFADYLISKGVVSKVIDVVSNDDRTFWVYPRLEIGFGNGFGGGIGIRHFDVLDKNYQFFANYIAYLNVDQRGAFGLSKPDLFYIGEKPFGFKFVTKLLHDKDTHFYGIGIGSSQDDKTNYAIDAIMTGAAATFEPMDKLMLEGGFYLIADTTMPGESPSVQTVFSRNELPGFEREITYAAIGLSLIHDTRDAIGRPESGGVRRGSFARYHGLGVNGFDFNWYEIELQQYFKLWLPRHVLGLRTMWQYRQPTGGGEVPFYYMSRMDVYSPVRGFSSGRFRDRGAMVFNIVYRFPVWEYLDGEFFFDSGRVFHTMSDISFKHMKFAGGGGIMLSTKNFFLARLELGYGGEGVKVLFKTSRAF